MIKRKEKIREKYWDEKRPGFDLDYVEVHISPEELDAFLKDHAERFVRSHEIDESTYLVDRKRREQMVEEIYKTASSVLTDRQFQIFILRYKFGFLETEIARQVGTIQPYISNTLKVCHSKIRKALNLEARKLRGRRKTKFRKTQKIIKTKLKTSIKSPSKKS